MEPTSSTAEKNGFSYHVCPPPDDSDESKNDPINGVNVWC